MFLFLLYADVLPYGLASIYYQNENTATTSETVYVTSVLTSIYPIYGCRIIVFSGMSVKSASDVGYAGSAASSVLSASHRYEAF